MATKTQRKRKMARRQHHARKVKAVAESARPTVASFVKEELGVELQPYQEAILEQATGQKVPTHLLTDVPKRAKCPVCRFSQKVRRDGTMGRHDVYQGSDALQCSGSGKRWDSGRVS